MNALLKPFNVLRAWDPFPDLGDFENRLVRFFGRPVPAENEGKEAIAATEWMPAVDIVEDEKEFLVKAELPDLKREEIEVTVENGELTLTGERKVEKEEKEKKYHRIERAYGRFLRTFTLPEGVNGDKVTADFNNGLLVVHLPKEKAVQPKVMDIKVN